MTTFEQVVKRFGGHAGLAKQLGIARQAVYEWDGKIPEGRAYQIEILTGGEITASSIIAAWPKKKRKAKRAH
jgi:DNA-binding transcriptional regulator YdaS (Cro superfamily)